MTPQQLDQLWTRIGWFASRRSLTPAEEDFAEAAWASCTDNLRVLFESGGADAALHRATCQGQVEAAEALIVCGASTRVRTRACKTLIEIARKECKFLR